LNREENIIENAYDLHYNNEQTSSYTLSPPSDRHIRGTIHYEPVDDSGSSAFDDSEFSIPASLASFSEQGGENVKTESDATEAASNLSGTILAPAESPLFSSQVPKESLPNSQAVPGSSSPSQDDSQHSINSCYCACHNYGCPRQRPALLRQESSPSALMIPFKRKRNFYHPPHFSDI
jgi:hypothetical protein